MDSGHDNRIIRNLSSQNMQTKLSDVKISDKCQWQSGQINSLFTARKQYHPHLFLLQISRLFQTSIHKLSSHLLFTMWKQNKVDMLVTWAK